MRVKNNFVDFTFLKEKNLPKQCDAFKQELRNLDLKYEPPVTSVASEASGLSHALLLFSFMRSFQALKFVQM